MTLWKWSKTAGSNDTSDSTVNLREGQSPSTLNDSARAMMAALAKYRDDISGSITTGGSSTAFTVTTNQVTTTLTNNFMVAFVPHTTSGASPTLNVDSTGARQIRGQTGVSLDAGALIASTPYVAVYKSGTDEWLLHGYYAQPSTVPIGAMMPFVGTTAPNSLFVLPYGQAISRTTYSALFALTSTTFGVGDGTTTFNLPDLRGRAWFGQDDMGGAAASRITTAGSSIDGTTRGAVGGAQNVTIAQANIPNYTLSNTLGVTINLGNETLVHRAGTLTDIGGGGGAGYINQTRGTITASGTITGSVTSGGSGTAVNKMPPAIILPCIMRVI